MSTVTYSCFELVKTQNMSRYYQPLGIYIFTQLDELVFLNAPFNRLFGRLHSHCMEFIVQVIKGNTSCNHNAAILRCDCGVSCNVGSTSNVPSSCITLPPSITVTMALVSDVQVG